MANKSKPMSLEAMLDEERKDVLKILEQTQPGRTRGSASSMSGPPRRTSSPLTYPRSPVRSMLDVDDAPNVKHHSIAGTGILTNPPPFTRTAPVRSMLDISTPLPDAARSVMDVSSRKPSLVPSTKSATTSPTTSHRAHMANGTHPRSLSDASTRPAGFGPRAVTTTAPPGNPESTYQFSGYLPSNPGGPIVPKRNTQGGLKSSLPSAMAAVVRSGDLGAFVSKDRGRVQTFVSAGIGKSKSPHNRLGLRSNSPHVAQDADDLTLNNGKVLDVNTAYRKLSDANLALSDGGLAKLGKTAKRRTNSDLAIGPAGNRLAKDYTAIDGEEAFDTSDEDHLDSDDEGPRGRKKNAGDDQMDNSPMDMGKAKGPRQAQSLMAAAEEERKQISDEYKVKSLFDGREPSITVTNPSGDRLSRSSRVGVHPNTSYDEGASDYNTPIDSDTEADISDIRRAQRLSVNMTPIVSTPLTSRCVRTIYRGDFAKMQQEAHDNQRRVRKYLVATDLSDEAAHALEWTIGTVIRDGDTLLAIYCVDEELGVAHTEGSADDQQREQATAIAASARTSISTPILGPLHAPSPLGQTFSLAKDSTSSVNGSASPAGRERSRAEQERFRAVQDITDRVSKLLRKTKLQVKVVIEVIHCKSPKHLITEVIDFISPTLVILGSRGRSALKGVILGSFSNYLVTKSSVPVMVARKRLRKHNKYKRPAIRLANNLANPAVKSLASAKID